MPDPLSQMHNNDSFDSHASLRFIGSYSLYGSLGSPAYEVHTDMSHTSQLNHFPSSQPSPVHWRDPKVLCLGECPPMHLCSKTDFWWKGIGLAWQFFHLAQRSLNSQKPKAIIYGTDPMEAATQLCILIQIPLAGRHILWCISGLRKVVIIKT